MKSEEIAPRSLLMELLKSRGLEENFRPRHSYALRLSDETTSVFSLPSFTHSGEAERGFAAFFFGELLASEGGIYQRPSFWSEGIETALQVHVKLSLIGMHEIVNNGRSLFVDLNRRFGCPFRRHESFRDKGFYQECTMAMRAEPFEPEPLGHRTLSSGPVHDILSATVEEGDYHSRVKNMQMRYLDLVSETRGRPHSEIWDWLPIIWLRLCASIEENGQPSTISKHAARTLLELRLFSSSNPGQLRENYMKKSRGWDHERTDHLIACERELLSSPLWPRIKEVTLLNFIYTRLTGTLWEWSIDDGATWITQTS